jgi:hypothetical protein
MNGFDFAMKNVLVEFRTRLVWTTELNSRSSGGLCRRPMYERNLYVAQPVGEGRDEYIQAKMTDAVKRRTACRYCDQNTVPIAMWARSRRQMRNSWEKRRKLWRRSIFS